MTAVTFTPLCGYGKQINMGGTDRTLRNSRHARGQTSKLIAIIDDDEAMQDSLRDLMEAPGLERSFYVAQINAYNHSFITTIFPRDNYARRSHVRLLQAAIEYQYGGFPVPDSYRAAVPGRGLRCIGCYLRCCGHVLNLLLCSSNFLDPGVRSPEYRSDHCISDNLFGDLSFGVRSPHEVGKTAPE